MNDRAPGADLTVPIGAVERDTGLSKDTLRVWERRYGFPAPQRDAFGERAYPLAQVDKLRMVKRLLDHGHRPGRIVGLPIERLQESGGAILADAALVHLGTDTVRTNLVELVQRDQCPSMERLRNRDRAKD